MTYKARDQRPVGPFQRGFFGSYNTAHLRKLSDLYAAYGLGSVKNISLITCLIPLARTANLNKMKDYIGAVLPKDGTQPSSHYKRLVRFFQDWSA